MLLPKCRKSVVVPVGKGVAPILVGWTKTKEGIFQAVVKCPECDQLYRFYAGTFDQEMPKMFDLELNRLLWGENIILAKE